MGKVKTHRASAKRFSVTGTGKVKMNHNQHRHKLRTGAILSGAMTANIRELIRK